MYYIFLPNSGAASASLVCIKLPVLEDGLEGDGGAFRSIKDAALNLRFGFEAGDQLQFRLDGLFAVG